jgi:hypothetical protein
MSDSLHQHRRRLSTPNGTPSTAKTKERVDQLANRSAHPSGSRAGTEAHPGKRLALRKGSAHKGA